MKLKDLQYIAVSYEQQLKFSGNLQGNRLIPVGCKTD